MCGPRKRRHRAGVTERRQLDLGREGETGGNSPAQEQRREWSQAARVGGKGLRDWVRWERDNEDARAKRQAMVLGWRGMCAEAWATRREAQGVCAGTAEHGTMIGQGKRGEDEQQREEDGDGEKSTGG